MGELVKRRFMGELVKRRFMETLVKTPFFYLVCCSSLYFCSIRVSRDLPTKALGGRSFPCWIYRMSPGSIYLSPLAFSPLIFFPAPKFDCFSMIYEK